MKTVAYLPFESVGNSYTDRIKEIISKQGSITRFEGTGRRLFRIVTRQAPRYDSIVLNWEENNILNPADGTISWLGTVKLFIKTMLMRLCTKSFIFVRHNRHPHATSPSSRRTAKNIVDLYERCFNYVLVHSPMEATGRRIYCPHPLYKFNNHEIRPAIPPKFLAEGYFMIFGRIMPYKNIIELASLTPLRINLLVCGSIGDKNYYTQLTALNKPNVKIIDRAISDDEAQTMIRSSNGLIIAHVDASAIVSGSFIFGLSCGARVHTLKSEFTSWVQDRLGQHHIQIADSIEELIHSLDSSQPYDKRKDLTPSLANTFGDIAIEKVLDPILNNRP